MKNKNWAKALMMVMALLAVVMTTLSDLFGRPREAAWNSDAARMEELTYRVFVWFVAEGVTVDTDVVVAQEVKPDVDPVDNFPSLGCVTAAQTFIEYFDGAVVDCHTPAGFEQKRPRRIQDSGWLVSLELANEFVRQQMYGLQDAPVDGVAQEPFSTNHENKQRGWLKVSVLRSDNTVMDNQDLWCEAYLEELPQGGKEIQRPRFRFRKLYSSLNTHLTVS